MGPGVPELTEHPGGAEELLSWLSQYPLAISRHEGLLHNSITVWATVPRDLAHSDTRVLDPTSLQFPPC